MFVSRNDVKSSYEEADVNIIKQCMYEQWKRTSASKLFARTLMILTVLLTAYVLKYSIESLVLMEAFASNRLMVNLN